MLWTIALWERVLIIAYIGSTYVLIEASISRPALTCILDVLLNTFAIVPTLVRGWVLFAVRFTPVHGVRPRIDCNHSA